MQSDFDEGVGPVPGTLISFKHSDFGSGLLAAVFNFHVAALYGHGIRTAYRKIDEEVIFGNIAFNKSDVFLYYCILPHLIGKLVLSIRIFADDYESRGVHIDAVGKADLE